MNSSSSSEAVLESIVAYSDAYMTALQARLDALGRDRYPHWGEKARSTVIYQGSDGIATFYYVPPPRAVAIKSGITIRRYPDQSLNAICQASSISMLHVIPVELGKAFRPLTMPLPNIEPLPADASPWMLN